jgi:hypothetical protein
MKMLLKAFPTLAMFRAVAALLCLAPLQNHGEDYTYATNNVTITITGYLGPGGAATIPSTINGLPVTAIGEWAFLNCTNLTSLDVPNTITDIGDHAFYACTGLKSLKLPNSITNITTGAFMHCTGLTEFSIPTNVTSIGDYVFARCTALTNITIPSSVATLGYAVFYGCSSLSAIAVDSSNPSYSSADGILFSKDQTALCEWPAGKAQSCTIPKGTTTIGEFAFLTSASLTNISIPNSVTNIGRLAFDGCTGLPAVTLPDNLTTIGYAAFIRCSSLTTIAIPASVTDIQDGAFASCQRLLAITVDPSNPAYRSQDGVLFDKFKTTLIQYPAGKEGGYDIPNTVIRLGEMAFAGCYYLTSVSIPDGVTVIPEWTFDTCGGLSRVILPGSLTSIRYAAFRSCGALTKVTIPSGVTDIQGGAFGACYSLATVYFAGDAPSIQQYAFDADNSATAYYLPGRTGWASSFAGLPAVLWNPLLQINDPAFGPRPGGFGLPITGTPDIPILLEATMPLSDGTWVPLQSCTLTNGSIHLSDPEWRNFPARFYRIRSP